MLSNFFKRNSKKDDDILGSGINEQYLNLRNNILKFDPSTLDAAEQQKIPDIYGVMIDMGIPELRYTVLALSDGTTSVYAGEGAARLGFGEHPTIAKMSRDLLSVAINFSTEFTQTKDYALPSTGKVRFFIFKKVGKYVAECPLDSVTRERPMDEILKTRDYLALMFRIGWAIITETRVIREQS